MQGEGLLVLSGKKQCSLQEQSDNVLASVATFEEEKNELEKWVCSESGYSLIVRYMYMLMNNFRQIVLFSHNLFQVNTCKDHNQQMRRELDMKRVSHSKSAF